MNLHNFEWDAYPGATKMLIDLWSNSSAYDISVRISARYAHVSKNGVIGKAHRLGLPDKAVPIQLVAPAAAPAPDLISNAFFQAAPERRARGYEALKAGDPISWGAIAGHVTVMA